MTHQNQLYPIFLKAEQLHFLIVGAGKVGLEKLSFLLKSSPNAQITIVGQSILNEIRQLAHNNHVQVLEQSYHRALLNGKQIVIAATEDEAVNLKIYEQCKAANILVNVADHPALCDFYMGGIVTKGHVKIAISTNGQSPTMAKRLRQFFESVLPDEIDELVTHLNSYRNTIKGNFKSKVDQLNELTKTLIDQKEK